jgi:hypothetical protein
MRPVRRRRCRVSAPGMSVDPSAPRSLLLLPLNAPFSTTPFHPQILATMSGNDLEYGMGYWIFACRRPPHFPKPSVLCVRLSVVMVCNTVELLYRNTITFISIRNMKAMVTVNVRYCSRFINRCLNLVISPCVSRSFRGCWAFYCSESRVCEPFNSMAGSFGTNPQPMEHLASLRSQKHFARKMILKGHGNNLLSKTFLFFRIREGNVS